jgi:hypothetical protein
MHCPLYVRLGVLLNITLKFIFYLMENICIKSTLASLSTLFVKITVVSASFLYSTRFIYVYARYYSQNGPNVFFLPVSIFATSYSIFTQCCLWLCFQGCSFLSPSDSYLGPTLTPTGDDCSVFKYALLLNNVSIFSYYFKENNLFLLEIGVVIECSLGK